MHLRLLSGSSMQVCGIRCRNPGRMTASFQWYQTPQNPERSATKKETRLQTCANKNVTWSSHRKKLVRLPPKEKNILWVVDFEIGYIQQTDSFLPSFLLLLLPRSKSFLVWFCVGISHKRDQCDLVVEVGSSNKKLWNFFGFYKVSV